MAGIFDQLTQAAIDSANALGAAYIYNTTNQAIVNNAAPPAPAPSMNPAPVAPAMPKQNWLVMGGLAVAALVAWKVLK